MEQERIGTILYFVMRKHLQNLIKVFHLRLNTRILSLPPASHSSKEDKRVFNSYDSYCTVNCPFFPRNNGSAVVCGVQRHHIPQLWSLSVRYACPRALHAHWARSLPLTGPLSLPHRMFGLTCCRIQLHGRGRGLLAQRRPHKEFPVQQQDADWLARKHHPPSPTPSILLLLI